MTRFSIAETEAWRRMTLQFNLGKINCKLKKEAGSRVEMSVHL